MNKFRVENEDSVDVRAIDNTSVRNSQIEKLNKIKATRDPNAVKASLEALTAATNDSSKNLLALSIEV